MKNKSSLPLFFLFILLYSCIKENRLTNDLAKNWRIDSVVVTDFSIPNEITIDTIYAMGTINLINNNRNHQKSKNPPNTNEALIEITKEGHVLNNIRKLSSFRNTGNTIYWDVEFLEKGYSRLQFHFQHPFTLTNYYLSYTVVSTTENQQKWYYYEFEDGFDNRLQKMEIVYVSDN